MRPSRVGPAGQRQTAPCWTPGPSGYRGQSYWPASLTSLPTAPGADSAVRWVTITHPFHPERGRRVVLVDERASRYGNRVWYEGENGTVGSVPADWTSLSVPDPFEVVAAGRVAFRPIDLVALVALIAALRQGERSAETDGV